MHCTFATPSIIFTDKKRLAGGLINAGTAGRADLMTASVVKAIEADLLDGTDLPEDLVSFLQGERSRVRFAAASSGEGDRANDRDGDRAPLSGLKLAERVTREVGASETYAEEGQIDLGGTPSWHPAGDMTPVTLDGVRIFFFVTPDDLEGSVRAYDDHGTTRFYDEPGGEVGASGCGACGVCGVCGVCSVCAEVNVASGATAVGAVTAVAALGMTAFAEGARGAAAAAPKLTREQANALQNLNSLFDLL